MAFPAPVGTPAVTTDSSIGSTHAITMPGSIVAGELLVVVVGVDDPDAGTVTESGGTDWDRLFAGDNGGLSTDVGLYIFAKVAEGSDSLTIAYDGGTTDNLTAIAFRVEDHGVSDPASDITIATAGNGDSSAQPDPPNANPGTAADYLWIEGFSADGSQETTDYESADYTKLSQSGGPDAAGPVVAVAYRQLNASSEDPGAMALGFDNDYVAFTMAVPPGGAAPISITPPAADLTLSTAAPTVTLSDNRTITPAAADLTLSTAAPTVTLSDNLSISPAAADLTLTTAAPTVTLSDNFTISPAAAQLSLSTAAPTVTESDNHLIAPGAGDLALSSVAPTVTHTENHSISPAAGQLSLTTQAPDVTLGADHSRTPAAADLLLSTEAPTVTLSDNLEISPAAGQLSLTTVAPTVTLSANLTISPAAGQLTLSSEAPTVTRTGDAAGWPTDPRRGRKRVILPDGRRMYLSPREIETVRAQIEADMREKMAQFPEDLPRSDPGGTQVDPGRTQVGPKVPALRITGQPPIFLPPGIEILAPGPDGPDWALAIRNILARDDEDVLAVLFLLA